MLLVYVRWKSANYREWFFFQTSTDLTFTSTDLTQTIPTNRS